MELLAEGYNKAYPGRQVQVVPRDPKDPGKAKSMGTRNGILNGIKGEYEGAPFIGFSSLPLNDEQRKQGGHEIEVARVALFFTVSTKAPPLDNLTTQEVIDIYTRKRKEWSPGGKSIRLVLRTVGESDYEILGDFIPRLKPVIAELLDGRSELGKGLPVKGNAQENASYIEQNTDALGLTSTNIVVTENRSLRPLKLDGVSPSPANVANGSYGLYKSVILVTGKTVTPEMRSFIAFVQSGAGRDILTRTGHVIMSSGRAP